MGSSPLTRGKRVSFQSLNSSMGLIPAHAGKTSRGSSLPVCPRAHPRSRGENQLPETCIIVGMGSSPLTRGKPPGVSWVETRAGLIPAHAGKTQASARVALTVRAHPRSRGENIAEMVMDGASSGSSPLTRGKPAESEYGLDPMGLIPAHAGKTWRSWCQSCWWGAHPRSRGENCFGRRGNQANGGSSPLTRGKLA